MTSIQLIACIGMIAGLFMVLHVSPRELSDSLFFRLTAAPGSIRADINETTKRKKAGFLRREITEAQAVLAASGRADRFPMVCFTSLLCFALGACIAIAAGNAFLVPVLAVGLMLTPFWYVKLTAGSFKKDVAAELETALSVITTAYLRTENFQQAVEENVRYLHPPVQEVFQRFLERKAAIVEKYGLSAARPQWRANTVWAGLLIAVGNEYAKSNPKSPREKQKTVEAICAQPEFARAIRELCPRGLGRNKQVVADLIGSGRFGTLTALYRLKNRM